MAYGNLVVRALLTALLASVSFAAEPPAHDHEAMPPAADAPVGCIPVAERANRKLGCFVLVREELGDLPDTPLYWHLHVYATRAAAAAAKGPNGSVVESYGKVWLLSIADASWNPAGGQRISRDGPLPLTHAGKYAAEYMEATFVPGMKSRVHRHPGPEAWYVLAGEQCLETPGKAMVVRAGESGIVPEGPPMMLWGTGSSERRSLVLILHDASKPMTVLASDWNPPGLCARHISTRRP
jgi:quercetin dioxygenase-like cupin family protein